MTMREYESKSNVEVIAQKKFEQFYADSKIENILKIVVPDFELLGKLAALRFIEWCQLNPDGVVSLATGKTPATFIKWVQFYIENWTSTEVQREFIEWGIESAIKPDFSRFILVQMDEYFPINPSDSKSFFNYINLNYLNKFGFKAENTLLMNLSKYCQDQGLRLTEVFPDNDVDLMLRFRSPKNAIETLQIRALSLVDQFASDFESKIKNLGGIGFFLGGIGPDGHIAFNFRWSEHCSRTRVLPINYESAAVAAAGFGGMKFIRNKAVLTIGLGTITQNPSATAIILADGLSKVDVVKNAIENISSVEYPATALQSLAGSRFYLTSSAASKLKTQQFISLRDNPGQFNLLGQDLIIDLAVKKGCSIDQLTKEDVDQIFLGQLFYQSCVDFNSFIPRIVSELEQKIKNSRQSFCGKTFLHTSPHPDDVLLGCFPLINQLTKNSDISHYFATMTSGSNAVQDNYFGEILNNLEQHMNYIIPLSYDKDYDLNNYLLGLIQNDGELKKRALSSRMLRNFTNLMKLDLDSENLIELVKNKITEIKRLILTGVTDNFIIDLKSGIREWEEDLVWGHFGFASSNVFHLNLGFYTSSDKSILFERDVKPVLRLLEKTSPDIITVALDPKDGGHATHYKVAEIIAQALADYKTDKKIEVWGYNNVWCKFSPTQANIFFPVSINDSVVGSNIFNSCYKSQVDAAIPSPEYDGPFCNLAQKIMFNQYQIVKTCLGDKFFTENADKQIIAANGLCFIKSMPVEEFICRMQTSENC